MPAKSKFRAISRRDMFRTGSALAAGFAAGTPAGAATTNMPGPEIYTHIGVRPFINCTATLTINGGSLMLQEVIAAVDQASHYHVNLDELMDKVSARLAELLQVEWGIVTAGAAAALTHATAGVLAGADPEKIQRLPNLQGLKDEAIIPRESRNQYDHAVRTLGLKVIEVNSVADVEAAIGEHTAIIYLLGEYFGTAKLDLKEVAPLARKAGVPILVDAAADYLIVPNPYLAQGASLVAYSGGKILRGPQNAGLLVGRKDLVEAAWANSAPHHSFGRGLKVAKEQIMGMLRAVEVWRTERDVQADFREWESWFREMSAEVTQVPGVKAELKGAARGGPFPTLSVSWDQSKVGITAHDVGHALLEGEPRIMTHAAGEGSSFMIRPVAMKPGEYKIVARRLREVLSGASHEAVTHKQPAPPSAKVAGVWDVELRYQVGTSRHKLFLNSSGNSVSGSHEGWAYQGDLKGEIDGDRVRLHSSLPADGNVLSYTFKGSISGDTMSGDVDLGEYGKATFQARRHGSRA